MKSKRRSPEIHVPAFPPGITIEKFEELAARPEIMEIMMNPKTREVLSYFLAPRTFSQLIELMHTDDGRASISRLHWPSEVF